MFASMLTFNPRSKATNIGYRLSLGAVFGCRRKIRINIERFGDLSVNYGFPKNEILKIDAQTMVTISRQFYNNKPSVVSGQ